MKKNQFPFELKTLIGAFSNSVFSFRSSLIPFGAGLKTCLKFHWRELTVIHFRSDPFRLEISLLRVLILLLPVDSGRQISCYYYYLLILSLNWFVLYEKL